MLIATDWMDEAACTGMEALFDSAASDDEKFAEQACLNLCRSCPVQALCLAYALVFEHRGLRHGVFGGHTAVQRERLVRGPRARRRVTA